MPGTTDTPKSASSSPAKVLSRFHALMLQQALKTMLQSDPSNNGKSTLARDVWRDKLAEQLANAATVSGSLTGPVDSGKP
jgi:hypothetical protein